MQRGNFSSPSSRSLATVRLRRFTTECNSLRHYDDLRQSTANHEFHSNAISPALPDVLVLG